jgi:hypothetical protein
VVRIGLAILKPPLSPPLHPLLFFLELRQHQPNGDRAAISSTSNFPSPHSAECEQAGAVCYASRPPWKVYQCARIYPFRGAHVTHLSYQPSSASSAYRVLRWIPWRRKLSSMSMRMPARGAFLELRKSLPYSSAIERSFGSRPTISKRLSFRNHRKDKGKNIEFEIDGVRSPLILFGFNCSQARGYSPEFRPQFLSAIEAK